MTGEYLNKRWVRCQRYLGHENAIRDALEFFGFHRAVSCMS